MAQNNQYGKRICAGDPKTVAEARAKYQADPEGQLIPFAIALYSFRMNETFAKELLELRHLLMIRAQEFGQIPQKYLLPYQEHLNLLDVLSTYIEWMSRRKELPASERDELLDIAYRTATYGATLATHQFKVEEHVWELLTLTAARTLISQRRYREAVRLLNSIVEFAPRIADANQRTRVYRKLGLLYRVRFRLIRGFYWGIRACVVPGVPLAVRAKSVAALLGIDR